MKNPKTTPKAKPPRKTIKPAVILRPEDFPAKPKPRCVIIRDGTGIEFAADPKAKSHAKIEKESIDTPLKLLVWLRGLSDRKWFTRDFCRDLIGAAFNLFGWAGDYGCSNENILAGRKLRKVRRFKPSGLKGA